MGLPDSIKDFRRATTPIFVPSSLSKGINIIYRNVWKAIGLDGLYGSLSTLSSTGAAVTMT